MKANTHQTVKSINLTVALYVLKMLKESSLTRELLLSIYLLVYFFTLHLQFFLDASKISYNCIVRTTLLCVCIQPSFILVLNITSKNASIRVLLFCRKHRLCGVAQSLQATPAVMNHIKKQDFNLPAYLILIRKI